MHGGDPTDETLKPLGYHDNMLSRGLMGDPTDDPLKLLGYHDNNMLPGEVLN